MERLHVDMVVEVLHRLRHGQSVRSISRDLGCSRVTVRRYQEWAERQGFLEASRPLPVGAEVQARLEPTLAPPIRQASSVAPYQPQVEALLGQGIELVAIHQRLMGHHGYQGSYSSLRRFVRRLRPRLPNAVVRLETPPGQQAQVDFGSVGLLRDAQGRRRRAYCFVMTLSYSRHCYVRFVFDQRVETWIDCHRRAFESFGGVPRELVIDNLKAAVLKANLEDLRLAEAYRRLAQHYGCLVHPCRPRTPEHKGKVENGVHYVQRNFLASEQPLTEEEANRKAPVWVEEVAGLRDHGTTHVPPLRRFREEEQAALLPLPAEPFALREVRLVKLHRDCHVQLDRSYYSAPWVHIGEVLEAYLFAHSVQLYRGSELLTTHPRATRPGQRFTRPEHYPPEQSRYLTHTREYCSQQAARIGPRCQEVVAALLAERPLDHLRSVQGLLRLAERYSPGRLEAACARALRFGDGRYRRVKSILAAGADQEALPEEARPPVRIDYTHARTGADFFPELSLAQLLEGGPGPC